tara:strand:- start:4390 stop:5535 length:1146 start_codon:yes stop_codon:yes gene_type:complete
VLVSQESKRGEWPIFSIVAFCLLIVVPLLNLVPGEESFFHFSDFHINLLGKYLAFAILALGIDLIWGYTGILSLGHGVFFGLGAYCMGMHLMLQIGDRSVYGSALPDFMVWNRVTELPLFWKPFSSFLFTSGAVIFVPMLVAAIFGFFAFRSRIRGVYFAIITQAFALSIWLLFNRNELNLGGTNGLTDFKILLGFELSDPDTVRGLYIVTVIALIGAYLFCRWLVRSRLGKVLVAIRDHENRLRYSGYSPAAFKLLVFVISAGLAGLAGALYVPQVGIITPSQMGVLPSIEMVLWVAVGGRGALYGAVIGAVGVNWARSYLTTNFPDIWLYFLGGLFVAVVVLFPNGIVGLIEQAQRWVGRIFKSRSTDELAESKERSVP